jgi:glycosyltransferase involved in cell wall biosynthesis
MRILHICSAREIGGGERYLADLANGLARRSHDVFAAIAPESPVGAELTALPNENIIELPLRNVSGVRSALNLSRFIRTRGIEIVHAHLARDYPLAALAAGRSDTRLVLTRHVLFALSRIHRLTLRRTARVIAVSEAVANSLRSQNIFPADKIVTIHNGIDLNRFAQGREEIVQRDRNDRLRVGMIGHIAPIKGQEDFIRAAAVVCQSRDDVDFVIAGEDKSRDGANRANIEKVIRELGLKQKVTLVGWIADVSKLLPTFDLFVSPARSEPFGLSIVEAMAAGIPVVATRSEGADEILNDNDTGRLVPIGSVESLASVIVELLADRAQSERLAQRAQTVARERFSLGRMVDETEEIYRAVKFQNSER